ncbi:MAG: CapA family protein, partial [Spirochaetes bacterium]|nr:CapA family protein [Spirochaetota bacterium]
MAHYNLQRYALSEEDKYLCLFKATNKIFLEDDLSIGNLETPICDELPIEGFPEFNAKGILVDAIAQSGIEVLSLANNHSLDQDFYGITTTINEVKKRGLIYAGTGNNTRDAKKVVIFKVKGFVIGFLSATWTTNIIQRVIKKDKPYVYRVPMQHEKMVDEFCKKINKAKKNVDLLIVAYHAGKEYVSTPIIEKKKLLKKFANSGADVILSHHPHVLQTIEYYNTKDNRKALIAYSLGNFISAQARYIPALRKKNNWIYDSVLSKTAE